MENRRTIQRSKLRLPPYPTTTIGSFPQTPEVRKARADYGKKVIDTAAYDGFLREETARAVRWQEEAGLDVLVHGEFERNDMVQYFGEQLSGFAFTKQPGSSLTAPAACALRSSMATQILYPLGSGLDADR